MENVAFPISWSNDTPKEDEAVSLPALPDKASRIPEHWDGDLYTGPQPPDDVENVEEVPVEPNFEDQNFQPPIYITLARIYDLLAIIALKVDPANAEFALNAHEAGNLIGEPPLLTFDDESLPNID